ncbi:hypothetical protein BH09BAC4_BH09BAC4_39650 [soil metagenome]
MKQALHVLRSYWTKLVDTLAPDRNQEHPKEYMYGEIVKDRASQSPGRIYYGIPGMRTYRGYIYKGRILKSGV